MGIKKQGPPKRKRILRIGGPIRYRLRILPPARTADLIVEKQIVRPHPQAGRQVFLYIESVLRVEIRKVLIIGVFCNIVLSGQEGPDAAYLQQTLPAVHHGKLVHGHQIFATMSSDEFKIG